MYREYEQAISVLPAELRLCAEQIPQEWKRGAEELRLRVGQPLQILVGNGEQEAECRREITEFDLRRVLEIASQASAHTVLERVCRGFVTIRGGHRIGLCGTAVVEQGKIINLRNLSSMAIRICKAVPGCSNEVTPQLFRQGVLQNTLLLAMPGAGKTTLLRDLIRNLSDGVFAPPMRIGVADERGELAATWQGNRVFPLGKHTDVMDDCPKAQALQMLLRGMNPQVLVMDEITAPEDVEAAQQAVGCGVNLIASAHGYDVKDLTLRPVYRAIFSSGMFQRVLLIRRRPDGQRRFRVEELT